MTALTAWGEGHTNNAPIWCNYLAMAADWGIPPWEVEENTPYHWFEKWRAYRHAVTRRGEVEAKRWQTRP